MAEVPPAVRVDEFPPSGTGNNKILGTNPLSTGTISPSPHPSQQRRMKPFATKLKKWVLSMSFSMCMRHWECAKERAVAGGSETAGNSRCVRERWWTSDSESLIRFYSPLLSPPWHKTVCKAKRNAETPDLPVSPSSLRLCHEKSVKLYCFTFCHAITQLVV